MRKWTARAFLVLLAAAVLVCVPATALFSLLRNWIADRPFSFWYKQLKLDLIEVSGFIKASWRNAAIDGGVESGA